MTKKHEVFEVVENHPGQTARTLSRVANFEVSPYLRMLCDERRIERYRPDEKTPYKYWQAGACPYDQEEQEVPPIKDQEEEKQEEQEKQEEDDGSGVLGQEEQNKDVSEIDWTEAEMDAQVQELNRLIEEQAEKNSKMEQRLKLIQDEVGKLREVVDKRKELTDMQEWHFEMELEESRLQDAKKQIRTELTSQK